MRHFHNQSGFRTLAVWAALAAPLFAGSAAMAADTSGFLGNIHRHVTVTSTVPSNGDLNPYAVTIAPVSAGTVQKGDVLVDNFNNAANLQGLGTTIVDYNPTTKSMTQFAQLPRQMAACPGGVGLSTAMVMLKSGYVIVGSTPSQDGTTGTKGNGCLIVLDSHGQVAGTITGPDIDDPWGNMAVVDNGTTATLFVSMAGFDLGPPVSNPPETKDSTVLRLVLSTPQGAAPTIVSRTVVGSGFQSVPDPGAFLIGPTGLAMGADGTTLYVSDALGNRVNAIADATTRTTSQGIGRIVSQDGLLQKPLSMGLLPDGHLLVLNGNNGQAVEIDPSTGKQLYAQWIDNDKAQTPPGNGDLFGFALNAEGNGFYYVEDDVNTLVLAQ